MNVVILEESSVLEKPEDKVSETPALPKNEDVFIAFARVYSGCLRKGQEVYVLGPKHDPAVALQMVCISKPKFVVLCNFRNNE